MNTIQINYASLLQIGRSVVNAGLKLCLGLALATFANIASAQVANIPSGTFEFTTDTYSVSDQEDFSPQHVSLRYSLLGARITVTRSEGANGRVWVPLVSVLTTNESVTTVSITTNGIRTVTTPPQFVDTVIVGQIANFIFDDYQMSSSMLMSGADIASTTITSAPTTNSDNLTFTNIVTTNTIIVPSFFLDTPVLDPLESTDLEEPLLGDNTALTVNVLSTTVAPGSLTNSLINFERSKFRVDVNEGDAVIHVTRSGGSGNQGVSVSYTINAITHPVRSGNGGNPTPGNTYDLEAGSDYAVADTDFTPVSGTLSWGANDSNDRTITIPILNSGKVSFNKDLQIQLYVPTGSTEPVVVGEVDTATLTILPDSTTAGLQPAGAVDRTWNKDNADGYDSSPPYLKYPGASGGLVYAAAHQPDGKTIIAGSFNSYDSNPYNRIVRLLSNGYQDPTFLVSPNSGANDAINAMALQADGKIIIGGNFTAFNGVNRFHIARLNTDGTVDTGFTPGLGADGSVWAVAVREDGKIMIGGDFTHFNGKTVNYVARLNTDGTLDETFAPGASVNGPVYALAVATSTTVGIVNPDYTKVNIGGAFDAIGSVDCGGVARLNDDGSLDTTFAPGLGAYNPNYGYVEPVYALAIQADKLLVGGSFSYMEFASYNGLVRLNTDGTVDTTFHPGTGTYNPLTALTDSIYAITLQPDGKILIGGDFTTFNQTRRVGVARLFEYGSVDTSFMDTAYNQFAGLINHYHNPDAVNLDDYPVSNQRNFVSTIIVESSSPNNVIIGGSFSRVGGGSAFHSGTDMQQNGIIDSARMDIHPRSNVARLIGGQTPGPGNITLQKATDSVAKNAVTHYVAMTRTNGSLGVISATCFPKFSAAGPGVATTSDLIGGDFPTWPTLYSLSPVRSWTVSPATFGANNFYNPTYGGGTPSPNVVFGIVNNTNNPGNLSAKIALADPDGTQFDLGGEFIALGAALGYYDLSPLTIIDTNVKPGVFAFSSTAYSTNQGSTAVITVTRTGGSDGTVQINYATQNGTATAPANYTAVSGTLTFAAGVTTRTFNVPTATGTAAQPDKTVNLVLSSVTGGASISQSNAVLTIINNKVNAGHIAFTSPTFVTNESAVAALVTVSRLGGSVGQLDVTAIVNGGTAVAGVNYVPSTNALRWNNTDATPKTITIPILHDGIPTADLSVNLRLTNGMLNSLADSRILGLSAVTNATLIVSNIDFSGTLRFATSDYAVKKSAGYALIPVIRTGGSAQTVTVEYRTVDGSATNGLNYRATNGVLTFTNGEVAKYFSVPIINNNQPDGLLSLNLLLTNATLGATLGTLSNAALNIIDTAIVDEPPGSADTTYSSLAGFNGNVYALGLQANNQLVVGGDFTMANGVPRKRLARLNADGSLDSEFLLPTSTLGADDQVRALLVQTDGRIVVGGFFSNFNSVVQSRLTRLNYDGSLDSTFNIGSGADNSVFALAQSPVDGKIFVAGAFARLNGVTYNGIGCLNTDGTTDSTFNSGGAGAGSAGGSSTVYALAIQPDGKAIIGGDFTTYNGVARNRLARLNKNGSLDTTFNPGLAANDSVRAVAIQLDGKILIGGMFTNYNGVVRNRIARLNADGSLDTTFAPGLGADDTVSTIALQTDGRIVLGGEFTQCSGVTRNRITRLNPDGSVDPTINFGAGASDFVAALVIQQDTLVDYPTNVLNEKIILAGAFTQYNSQPHHHLARIFGGSVSGVGAFEFSAAEYQINETGLQAAITVVRTGGTSGTNVDGSGNVSVSFATANNTATAGINYQTVTTNLIFPVGEIQRTVLIPVLSDGIITNELLVDLLLSPVAPAAYGNQPTAVLKISNDDAAISFATDNYQVPKNIVNHLATIDIVRLGSPNGTSSVVFSTTTNGNAVIGTDYTPVADTVVTFAPGVTNAQVTIPIIDNNNPTGARTVTMQLSNVLNALLYSPTNATLTIIDTVNAPGSLSLASSVASVSEGAGSITLPVLRTNGHTGIVSVNYTTTAGTAVPGVNYTTTSGTLTFGDGVTNKSIAIPVIDNALLQGPLTFSVRLSTTTGGASLIAPSNTVVTVLDNEVGFRFENNTNAFPENYGFANINVLRLYNTNGAVSVNYQTVDGTALAGTSYSNQTATLNFTNGETIKSFSIPLINRTNVTGDLAFGINLNSPVGGQLASPSNTVVVVQDADAGISFTNSTTSVLKNAGFAVITVVCSNPRVEPVVLTTNDIPLRVDYYTKDGTANSGIDYQSTTGTLYFTNGISTNTFTVPIYNNSSVTGDRTFSVVLTNVTAPGQLTPYAVQSVVIAESNSGLRFSQTGYQAFKNGVTKTIEVYRTGNTNNVVTVNYQTANGSAVAGVNYVATNGVLVFTNGVVTQSFNVGLIANSQVQPNLSVALRLLNPTNGFLVTPSAATLTILENSGSYVIPSGSALAAESGPANGVIDSNETVQVLFAFRDSAGLDVTNLIAYLLPTNGVTSPAPASQTYGPLKVYGHSVTRPFTFRAIGTNTSTITPTFSLYDNTKFIGSAAFNYTVGTWTTSFTNTNAIIILDNTNASPYPSVISVSNVGNTLLRATVTLDKLRHTSPGDISVDVISPSLQNVLLMAHAGGQNSVTNIVLTFDDAATNGLSTDTRLTTSTNRPTQYLPIRLFP